jgi:hypothetical protein
MRAAQSVMLALAVLLLSACTTTRQIADAGFQPPQGNYRLIVMQPDISVSVLTAGGMKEQREDWTNQARENVLNALAEQQAKRGGETKIAATRDDTGADSALAGELISLHRAVGEAVRLHKYSPLPLPTKAERFDWTLGPRSAEFGAKAGADYALFLNAQDSFSSGGRVALQALAVLGCGLGVCVVPGGGSQFAFASLVDLKTGQLVWCNTLLSSVGDIRTPEGSAKMVSALLDKMQTSTTPAKNSRRRKI